MQFNRRQNRIAGPGFHYNVRYDDQTMARAHSQVNECHPKLKLGTTHKENFDVKEQELLVCQAKSGMYHDGYTHCFSFVNGLPDTKGVPDDQLEEKILSSVRYVGVATTEYKPSRSYSEQGFVAQVGGVSTLINESQETIKPGDTLVLGVNLALNRRVTRDKGIPREKIRFCVKKAKVGDALITEALAAAGCGDGSGPTAAGAADARKKIAKAQKDLAAAKKAKDKQAATAAQQIIDAETANLAASQVCSTGRAGLKKFLAKLQEMNSRVIGRSCSYARPGDRLEVVLQPRNPY
tara:strand:- start:1123 stop:2004 length:882 start_codon:yes stop_codon:yes gene_type:complete